MVRQRLEAVGFKNFAIVEGKFPIQLTWKLFIFSLPLQCLLDLTLQPLSVNEEECAGEIYDTSIHWYITPDVNH